MKTPKKAAEGPFSEDYQYLHLGERRVCDYGESLVCASVLNEILLDVLKSPSGKRWMEESGVVK